MKQLLFVYGTLRRGEAHHQLLGKARYLGRHRTARRYTMLDLGGFPAIVALGRDAVVGEVFAIGAGLLARLDAYEDCPREYARTRIDTRFGKAWVYIYRRRPPRARTILGGDWCRRAGRAQ